MQVRQDGGGDIIGNLQREEGSVLVLSVEDWVQIIGVMFGSMLVIIVIVTTMATKIARRVVTKKHAQDSTSDTGVE